MNLIILGGILAVAGAAKLDRSYLPPASASTAGGRPEDLQTPFSKSSLNLPKGGSTNEFEGVVVDAASETAGPRQTDETGLGGPRINYGSIHSKVGEAAFAAPEIAGFRLSPGQTGYDAKGPTNFEYKIPQLSSGESVFSQELSGQRNQLLATKDQAANILRYENDVQADRYKYAFDTDNGISASANGIEANGVQAEGGFSYKSDDGQVFSVTYTADEGGYQPKGDHLPTPPPIPEEILRSIEQNARDEAAGIVDDGSYDAQKYNTGGDYSDSDSNNGRYNDKPLFTHGNRPGLATSGSFNNQNNIFFAKPNANDAALKENKIQGRPEQSMLNIARPSNAFSVSPLPVSGSSFGNVNEYLPPTGTAQNENPVTTPAQESVSFNSNLINGFNSKVSNTSNIQTPNYGINPNRPQKYQTGISTNAFISSRPTLQNQFSQYYQDSQKIGSNSLTPNRFSSNSNEQGQIQSGSFLKSAPELGSLGVQSQSQTKPKMSPLKATPKPSTELLTPFEPNEKESLDIPGSSKPDIRVSPDFNSLNSQNRENQPLSIFSEQNSDRFNTILPKVAPSLLSTSLNVQSPNSQPQGFSSGYKPISFTGAGGSGSYKTFSITGSPLPQGQKKPSALRRPTVNRVFSTTQKPYYQNVQQFEEQKPQSYNYNQPSKPLNSLLNKPQSSESQITFANKFSGLRQQFPTMSQFTASSTPASTSLGHFEDSTKYPRPPTIVPTIVSPTVQTQILGAKYNGITQASATSFGFASPTHTTFFNSQNTGILRPGSQQSDNDKLSSSFVFQDTEAFSHQPQLSQSSFMSSSSQSFEHTDLNQNLSEIPRDSSQQVGGEVYEYNKPEQGLPAPKNEETINTNQEKISTFSDKFNTPQFQGNTDNQGSSSLQLQQMLLPKLQNTLKQDNYNGQSSFIQKQQNGKPFEFTGQTFGSQFGQRFPTISQINQEQPEIQTGSELRPFGASSVQNNQSQGTVGSGTIGINKRPVVACCRGNGQFEQQPTQMTDSGHQSSDTAESARMGMPTSFSISGKGEHFGSPDRKPPSFDKNGYHY